MDSAAKRDEYLSAMKLATVPLARLLLALAYYLDGPDPAVAEAAFDVAAFRLELPSIAQLDKLARSDNPLDQAIFELWRGRAPVSSVVAARLTREQADALLIPTCGSPPTWTSCGRGTVTNCARTAWRARRPREIIKHVYQQNSDLAELEIEDV